MIGEPVVYVGKMSYDRQLFRTHAILALDNGRVALI